MKLRRLPLASLAWSGVVTLPVAAGHHVTRDGAEVVLADDGRDARPQATGALFTRLRDRRIEGNPQRLLRAGSAPAPNPQ
ncbi:MAG TPA: hypothetical protein DEP35_00205 [Deltaproteobacteria bacterium]|jgi:hypothetical protein|nr:hypothetical protein [Deltaproteobacteria bacterium]